MRSAFRPVVSALAVAASLSLSPALHAQRMICVESGRQVHEVDIATGTKTQIGQLSSNAGTSGGFAYDGVSGRLYLTSSGNDALYLIDVTSWEAKFIGGYGLVSVVMQGIEWDSSTNTLYAMDTNGNLYTVDTATGAATQVGNTGFTSFHNLGYDPVNDTMWMTISGPTDSFFSVDRASGTATLIGPLVNSSNPNSLAYNIDNLTLYMADNTTDNLYTMDLTTGEANLVGPMGSGNVLGMAYIAGTGRLSRTVHGCGPTTVFVSGNPNTGGAVDFTVENTSGFPFVGFGLTSLGVPFCGCTVGHEWSVAAQGANVSLPIPNNASLVGTEVYAQGLDFLGTGGCPAPQLTLTDTITITIGS